MDAGERRLNRHLDVVQFIKNAVMLQSLSKLSLSKSESYLIRRQPKVHLLDNDSSRSSSNSDGPNHDAKYSQNRD